MKRKATKIVLRWAVGSAVGMLVSWPVLLGLVLLLLVVIILSSAGGPAALAPPTLAASNYSCSVGATPMTGVNGSATAAAGDYAGITLNAEQMKIAGTITAVVKQMNLTRRADVIAIAVAMQESTLDPTVVNGPWVGLFQQAPDPVSGLYTRYDRTDPAGATRMFLDQLARRVPGYDTDPRQNYQLGEVVQESRVRVHPRREGHSHPLARGRRTDPPPGQGPRRGSKRYERAGIVTCAVRPRQPAYPWPPSPGYSPRT